ncbi:hypothetical protein [Streptomyces sp. NPDC050504]|uniref:hypothetical protein n=1 Tax=Streptomyces sp. NPDC050504 TaxID=3365618 RepID=UPI0037A1BDC8
MTEAGGARKKAAAKPKKKAPSHFKTNGSNLVQGLIAGADSVAGRSFLGGGGVPEPSRGTDARSGAGSRESLVDVDVVDEADDEVEAAAAAAPPVASVAPVSPGTPGVAGVPSQAREAAAPEPYPSLAPTPVNRRRGLPSVVYEVVEALDPPEPHGPGQPWAHEALHRSFAEAKIHSEKWRSHGFRIEPEVLELLKDRIKADRRSSRNAVLSKGHYLDAALRHVPDDIDELIALAHDFQNERMGYVEAGTQSTYRVGEHAFALVSNLNQALQEVDYGRRGLYVVSAALERFLHAMALEGELHRPRRRRQEAELRESEGDPGAQ